MTHIRTALASVAGLALAGALIGGAASTSAADPGTSGKPEKTACAQEQRQYDKAVAKYEELQAKFAAAKDEAEEAEGTEEEAAAEEEATEAKKAKKAQAKRVEKKQAKLEKCQAAQEPTEEPTDEPTEEPTEPSESVDPEPAPAP